MAAKKREPKTRLPDLTPSEAAIVRGYLGQLLEKMNQAAVGEQTGLAQGTISSIQNGKSPSINFASARAILALAGVPLMSVFGGATSASTPDRYPNRKAIADRAFELGFGPDVTSRLRAVTISAPADDVSPAAWLRLAQFFDATPGLTRLSFDEHPEVARKKT